jgi:anti-anti-sigma regulatory factor
MAGIQLSRWIEKGRRVLRLPGTFDGAVARELLTQIRCSAERDIVVDVAFVRGFDEVGVTALARLVESSDEHRIRLRGLSSHQLRILRYLGARLSQVGAQRQP